MALRHSLFTRVSITPPKIAPAKVVHVIKRTDRNGMQPILMKYRVADKAPPILPTLLVATAAAGGTLAINSNGRVINPPPPATASTPPATTAIKKKGISG